MGVAVGKIAVESDLIEQLVNAFALLGPAQAGVLKQWLANDGGHGHAGVQTGLGVLKNHLHGRTQLPEQLGGRGTHLLPVDDDLTRRRLVEAQHGAPAG